MFLKGPTNPGGCRSKRLEDEARAGQWSLWCKAEIERPVLTVMFNRAVYPEDMRDAAAVDVAEKDHPLGVLDGAVIGGDFAVADLNVAAILSWVRPARMDFDPFP
jgi:glutathione S-transferase